jgi:BirA family biotin operon repressor/biotin-[acetyl-CoA-carboxylase] ligase
VWEDLDRPPLRRGALQAALGPTWRTVEVVDSTGSTNADLAARAREGEPSGLVLVADHQASGRGRLDRSWTAPARASIAVSVLLRPSGVPQHRVGWLPLLAGLSVVEALTRVCGVPARLKWPNDVLVPVGTGQPDAGALRKVCGILAELVPGTTPGAAATGAATSSAADAGFAVVLGAGINVSQGSDELPVPTATSLALAGSATTDRDTVLRAYLRALGTRYQQWVDAQGDPRGSGLGPAYREACVTLGLQVQVQRPGDVPLDGTAQEVDDDGRLVVLDSAGALHALAAGDVVHVRDPHTRDQAFLAP